MALDTDRAIVEWTGFSVVCAALGAAMMRWAYRIARTSNG